MGTCAAVIVKVEVSEGDCCVYLTTTDEKPTVGIHIPSTVVLADPEFGQPGSIDLLLGAEVYSRLIGPGLIELGDDKPTLQETALGWIVFGAVRRQVPAAIEGNVMTITREDPLPAVEKFWKLDTFNTEVPAMTVQERLCEEHFLSNVQFCPDQRLMVRLPFAENPWELGKTLALAQRKFSVRTGSSNARRIREFYG